MSKIQIIKARQILNSIGNPTIETQIVLDTGISAKSSAPSGMSHAEFEAVELRDEDLKKNNGLGVLNALKIVNEIITPKLIGLDVLDQAKIDRIMMELDGTPNKANLGSNTMLSVSVGVIKAAAASSRITLHNYIKQFVSRNSERRMPLPLFTILEGGKSTLNTLNFQDFLLVPASSKSFSESLELATTVYSSVKKLLVEKNRGVLVATRGGFSPNIGTNQEALSLIRGAIDNSNLSFSLDVFLGLNCGATSYYDGKVYKLSDRAISYNTEDLTNFYINLISEFSLVYIEDPVADNDWDGWKKIFSVLEKRTVIVGNDLIATSPYRLQMALDNKVIGGVVIKPGQVGTVTEALAMIEIAKYSNLKITVSDRSGETEDDFIADFAVGVGADYTKFGAPARERIAKYNRLLAIETEI